MFKSQKHTFWQALLVTLFIFGLGIFVGILLENSRIGEISELYGKSEIYLLDIRLQNEIYSEGEFNCEFAFQENMKFADDIYEEVKLLEKYLGASRLTDEKIELQHKKYVILRGMLFLNSLKIKENCDLSYHNVVYFYIADYNNPRLDLKVEQKVFSRLLFELKQKRGDEVLLIPIAVNKDISSVNVILDKYNITYDELPVVLIDEKIKITELETLEELEVHLG